MESLSDETLLALQHYWALWARPEQLPPPGDWRTWLFLGGRGAGKTRAGAEWIRTQVFELEAKRVGLVAATMNDAREVMLSGESGLLNIGPSWSRPTYEASRKRLVWPNGAVGQVFSAEEPDRLRGPQFDCAWADEAAAWSYPDETWDMLQFGLRLGDDPRAMVTTTPRPIPLIKRLLGDQKCVVTRAATHRNEAHLADGFVQTIRDRYGATMLGRQELNGELIEAQDGALWTPQVIEACRSQSVPELGRIILAIDPPVTGHQRSDACGMIIAGSDGYSVWVLSDESTRGCKPSEWARRAHDISQEWGVTELIVESNQGGELVRDVLETAGIQLAIRLAWAGRSKSARAEPVAALYAAGRVFHVGAFETLEDEMLRFGSSSWRGSPDRMDALVWAVTSLLLDRSHPSIRKL